ncbi:MAG: 6-bladed beta-propeller [Bacteroidota bacterium]
MRVTMNFQMILLIAFMGIIYGCSGSKQSAKDIDLVWPSPPDEPRVKYLKTMQGEDDYGSGLSGITRALAGGSTNIALSNPYDVCTDGQGRVWVTDAARGLILFDDNKKEVTTLGELSKIPLDNPRGIAYGNSKLFVGIASLGQIAVLTPDGKDLYLIGKRGSFPNPVDVVYDSLKHRVIVVDNKLNNISVFSEKGDSLFVFGKRGEADGLFNFPQSAAVDSQSNIYVVDAFNYRVEIFDSTGKFLRKFGSHGDAWGMFARPKGIVLDTYGNIYVVDSYYHNFQVFNQKGELLLFVGKFSAGNDGFQDPVSLAIDQKNTIYVTDHLNSRVQVFQLLKGN